MTGLADSASTAASSPISVPSSEPLAPQYPAWFEEATHNLWSLIQDDQFQLSKAIDFVSQLWQKQQEQKRNDQANESAINATTTDPVLPLVWDTVSGEDLIPSARSACFQ
jgi:hypothetical protein